MGNSRSRIKSKSDSVSPLPNSEIPPEQDCQICKAYITDHTKEGEIGSSKTTCSSIEKSESTDTMVATLSDSSTRSIVASSSRKSNMSQVSVINVITPAVYSNVVVAGHSKMMWWEDLVKIAQAKDEKFAADTFSSRRRTYSQMERRAYIASLLIKAFVLKDHCAKKRWVLCGAPHDETSYSLGLLVKNMQIVYDAVTAKGADMSWIVEVRSSKNAKNQAEISIFGEDCAPIQQILKETGYPDEFVSINNADKDSVFHLSEEIPQTCKRITVNVCDDNTIYPFNSMKADMEMICSALI